MKETEQTEQVIFRQIRSILLKNIEESEKKLQIEKLCSDLNISQPGIMKLAIKFNDFDRLADQEGTGMITYYSLLHYAVKLDSIEMASYLVNLAEELGGVKLKKHLLNMKDVLGKTALHHSASLGQVQIAEFLIESGATIDSLDNFSRTPLLTASSVENNSNVCDLLISRGADVKLVDLQGKNLVHNAADAGNLSLINATILAQVNINAQEKTKDETALHYAAKSGKTDVLARLVTLGADPNLRNEEDKVPLHYALEEASIDDVRILINANTNLTAIYGNLGFIFNYAITAAVGLEITNMIEQARVTQENAAFAAIATEAAADNAVVVEADAVAAPAPTAPVAYKASKRLMF